MLSHESERQMEFATAKALAAGVLPAAADLPAGVRALDLWSSGGFGAALFWVDRELDPSDEFWLDCERNPTNGRALHQHIHATRRRDGSWAAGGGGSSTIAEPKDLLDGKDPGFHVFGGGGQDPVRVTIGIATPEVSVIRLRHEHGVQDRPLGVDGFCMLGITQLDPITYARVIGHDGREMPGEPLLL